MEVLQCVVSVRDAVYWLQCEVANGVIWEVEMFMYVGSFVLMNTSTVGSHLSEHVGTEAVWISEMFG